MLQGLENAEKLPNKGFKRRPQFKNSQDLSDKEDEEEEQEEDEDEVVLLEDTNDNTGKQGRNISCQSRKVKDPHEYQCRDFKIPRKSSQNDHHSSLSSSNGNQGKGNSPKYHEVRNTIDPWGFESAFKDDKSTLQTKVTKSPSLKSKRSVRSMIQRQDGTFRGILGASNRNSSSSLRPARGAFVTNRRTIMEEPFQEEINQVMKRNQRTVDHKNVDDKKDCKVYVVDLKNSHISVRDSNFDKHRSKLHDNAHGVSSSPNNRKVQYFENSDLEKSLEIDISSDSEKDFREHPTADLKSKNSDNNTETSTPQQGRQSTLTSFPSYAATPRHSIHETSTSEDEKDYASNTKTFYGSESKPALKTYSSRNVRIIDNKVVGRRKGNERVRVGNSDVEESPTKQGKKRKLTTKKNLSKNPKKENSICDKQRKKHKAEPDLLLISSSDEEDNHSGLEDGNPSGTESMSKAKHEIDSTAAGPYKSVPAENGQTTDVSITTRAIDNPFERDSFTAEIMLGSKCMLGKLGATVDGALEITAHQLKWRMKLMGENDKPVEHVILILANDLTAFKIHVDCVPKIIVLGVNQRCALKLRGKISGLSKFFNPSSAVVEEKEIVLQVDDVLSPETLADMTEWVQDSLGKTFKEMSNEEAEKLNESINSADTSLKSTDTKQKSHYNTRSSCIQFSASRPTVTPTKMVIYPFPPLPGGITVTSADVECLAEGEFLNDVIIDFYLKYIYHDKLSEDDKKRTHIFSSFFYKRLTQKNSSNNEFFQSVHDRMHNQVKKWTRNVDIFSKDFIIVPINESAHWYLAIICFPGLVEPIVEETIPDDEENIIDDSEDFEDKKKSNKLSVEGKTDDEDDSDLERSALAVGAKKPTTTKKSTPKKKPVLKANPCILIFDSLANTGRSRVFTNLRHYLSREWKAKRPDRPTRDFTNQKGTFPKVPEQDNHCDCGIFVLQYVESFFEDPIRDYRPPIQKTNWFTHNGISGKRQEIKDLILCLKEQYTSTSR